MKQFLLGILVLALGAISMGAQSLEDLNIQIHGYATQGFLYTSQNNILTTNSSDGSPAWTEAVTNLTAQPDPKLRIGVQIRYFLLGNYGNAITLDWASADYRVNDRFGARFGKVKTPSGLFNDIQDIDPSYQWALLPQGVYPIGSRNSVLSHYGGVVYGTLNMQKAGKLEYRGWGGQRVLGNDDGYFLPYKEAGMDLPNGLTWTISGIALRWKTPLHGLMFGISDNKNNDLSGAQLTYKSGSVSLSGTESLRFTNTPVFFGRFENNKWMLAGEVTRLPVFGTLYYTGMKAQKSSFDIHSAYGMATYKASNKLSTGVYFSQSISKLAASGPSRYSKDWALSGRYDFSPFVYLKVEEHLLRGTNSLFDTNLNTGGLKPTSKLTVLKLGVSF